MGIASDTQGRTATRFSTDRSAVALAHTFDPFDEIGLTDALVQSRLPIAVIVRRTTGLKRLLPSKGFLAALELSSEAAKSGRLQDIFSVRGAASVGAAVDRAVQNGRAVKVTVGGRNALGESVRRNFTARPSSGATGRRTVLLELDHPADRPPASDQIEAPSFDGLNLVSGGMVYIYDPIRDRNLYLSGERGDLLGYAADSPLVANRPALRDLFHPDDLDLLDEQQAAVLALADGQVTTLVCRVLHADGGWRWVEARERVLTRGAGGRPSRILGFICDISERRRLLDALAGASKALLHAEQEERRRIARELHDSTAQHLVAIDLTLSRLEREAADRPDALGVLEDIRTSLKAAHREIRTFSYLLHPPDLERAGLAEALRKFLDGFQQRTGLDVTLTVIGARRRLPPLRELALYRIAQEALMNAHKHAGARNVEVRLTLAREDSILEVRDDSAGLTSAQIGQILTEGAGGVGIAGMKARMVELGGALEMIAEKKGLLIRARIPSWIGEGLVISSPERPRRGRRPKSTRP